MKQRSNIFSVLFYFTALTGAALCAIHIINTIIFKLCGGRRSSKSIWKSNYGNIAFIRSGDGPPLLLVHGIGIGAGSGEWDENISELSKTRTVFAVDLPGFGYSEKRRMTYNSYYYAVVINSFIRNVIGRKTDVAALCASGGIVLAGAELAPELYGRIAIVNPYDEGMGAEYKYSLFVKAALTLPIIGSLVYNCISSKQSVLSYLCKASPAVRDYADNKQMMEKQYRNAHLQGATNKYAITSFINGYNDTSVFRLMEYCKRPLCVAVSAGSPLPLLSDREGLTIAEIKSVKICPNLYAFEEFHGVLLDFLGRGEAV